MARRTRRLFRRTPRFRRRFRRRSGRRGARFIKTPTYKNLAFKGNERSGNLREVKYVMQIPINYAWYYINSSNWDSIMNYIDGNNKTTALTIDQIYNNTTITWKKTLNGPNIISGA